MVDHPQYWASPVAIYDEMHDSDDIDIARAMNAQVDDIIGVKHPDKSTGYRRHIYKYRVTVDDIAAEPGLARDVTNIVNPQRFAGGYWMYGSCYIVGPLPESLTSKREFKEIPWPHTLPTK